jgi:NAD(P)-dependent dehydrogenase (short-subunit alcohol dehydrogenase family)
VEAHPDKVRIVKLTSGEETDNKAAVAEIQSIAGRLDVVIANAGIGLATGSVLETSPQTMSDHFAVNTIGPLVLFQATYPLLKASTSTPKFIPISSLVGSIKLREVSQGLTLLAYGTSKAALNYLTMKLRADHEGLSMWFHS